MLPSDLDLWHMRRALDLAVQGQGAVEPNPMVGCVVARGAEIIGEGWHRRFGGDHAEVEALRLAGPRARGSTLYVTLEPCCHQGKTPPCTRAILAAGVGRVVAAMRDPFPKVAGGGLAELRAAGVEVEVGPLEAEARRLNAPYLKLLSTGRPWVLAKWAMTLDGRIATATGSSRWISGEASRAVVHQLRGRVDAILVGRGTAEQDDPLLTARPPGAAGFWGRGPAPFAAQQPEGCFAQMVPVPLSLSQNPAAPRRTALRVVVDSRGSLGSQSQLALTARQTPVLVAVAPLSAAEERRRLVDLGCEVFVCEGETPDERLESLLDELGRRRMTNVLVEGGSRLLGGFFDRRLIDEVHVFIAPRLIGGAAAPGAIGGRGIEQMAAALKLDEPEIRPLDGDVYVSGRITK